MKQRQSKALIFYAFIREIFGINIPSPWNGLGRTVGKCVYSNVLYAGAGIGTGIRSCGVCGSYVGYRYQLVQLVACLLSICLLGAGIFSFHVFLVGGPKLPLSPQTPPI